MEKRNGRRTANNPNLIKVTLYYANFCHYLPGKSFPDCRLYSFFSSSSALGTAVNHTQLRKGIRSHSGQLTRQKALCPLWTEGPKLGFASRVLFSKIIDAHPSHSTKSMHLGKDPNLSGIRVENLNYAVCPGGYVATWKTSLWETRG